MLMVTNYCKHALKLPYSDLRRGIQLLLQLYQNHFPTEMISYQSSFVLLNSKVSIYFSQKQLPENIARAYYDN